MSSVSWQRFNRGGASQSKPARASTRQQHEGHLGTFSVRDGDDLFEQEDRGENDRVWIQDERDVRGRGGADRAWSDAAGYDAPPQDIPVNPGQLLRFVLKPTENEKEAARKKIHPQLRIDKFWKNFDPDYEGGVTHILPDTLVDKSKKESNSKDKTVKSVNSYQDARNQCIKSVKRIIRECRALNQKFTDIHFDVERDLKLDRSYDCLFGLRKAEDIDVRPQDVKRVTEICENPQFYKDGATFDDIMQGNTTDCWLLAALSALTANQKFIHDICVIRDEEIGVYGFVFNRDGEWQPCIVDDKLYLKAPAFEESGETILSSYSIKHRDQEQKYIETFQMGSKALYFAACRDDNETWVPLLEKAFAKAHGDYDALEWGSTGEALEDLTGGVSTEIYTHNILNTDLFWYEKLSRIGKDYIFSCATASWLDSRGTSSDEESIVRASRRKGVVSRHAYAVLSTYEGHGQRLVKIRNPWGESEWTGPWSDGSKEWTAEWVDRLQHKFGDDGVFWISYEDMLKKYRHLDCTRVFGPEWRVTQQWAQVQVPWNILDYQQTHFTIEVPANTEAVIVLSQLDDRYFRGFEGRYFFRLQFRLQKADEPDEDEYLTRSKINYNLQRSTNVEINLDAGKYVVLFKVEALDVERDDIETVIRDTIALRKNKVTQIAALYDLAHQKGRPPPRKDSPANGIPIRDTEGPTKSKPEETTEKQDPKLEQTLQRDVLKMPDSADPQIAKSQEDGQQSVDAEAQTKGEKDIPKDDGKGEKTADMGKQQTIVATTEQTNASDQLNGTGRDQQPKSADEKATQTEREVVVGPPSVLDWPPRPGPFREEVEQQEDDPDRNPWNAFCTVGLRVYSKSTEVQIGVRWPGEDPHVVLDGEDIAKSALVEAEAAS